MPDNFLKALAAAAASLALACGGDQSPLDYSGGTFEQHLDLAGTMRDYIVHVPPNLDPTRPAPLLFVFHGAEGTADGMMLITWLNAEARRKGFVAVYPDSDGGRWDLAGLTDVALVDAIVERIGERILIDEERLLATGFSNGALMTIHLACHRSDRVTGVGILGGSIPDGLGCTFRQPIRAVFILGDEDRQFPFHEGSARISGQLSAEASAEWWLARNGCDSDRTVVDLPDSFDDGTSVHRWDYPTCPDSQTLTFYEIRGGGHTWPGSPLKLSPSLGRKSRELHASSTIADFLVPEAEGGS